MKNLNLRGLGIPLPLISGSEERNLFLSWEEVFES
jgi:hypothetical protein